MIFFVLLRKQKCKVFSLNNSKQFSKLLPALYATDARFHHANCPKTTRWKANYFTAESTAFMDIRSTFLFCLLKLQSLQVRIIRNELQMSLFYVKNCKIRLSLMEKKMREISLTCILMKRDTNTVVCYLIKLKPELKKICVRLYQKRRAPDNLYLIWKLK